MKVIVVGGGVIGCSIALAVIAVAGCGGTATGPTNTPAPTASEPPTASPTVIPAAEILRLSDEAMNNLRTMTEMHAETGYSGVAAFYKAPDRIASDPAEPGGGCVVGNLSWRLSNTEPFEWLRQEDLDQPIQWPSFNRTIGGAYSPGAIQIGATAPSNIGVVGETIFDDQPTYLLTYDYLAPSTEGPFPVKVKEWIAKDTFWLLKQEVWQNDPFGFTGTKIRVFTDHNKPVDIPCADFVETGGAR